MLKNWHRHLARATGCAAVAYMVAVGFHTLSDPDVWWQLASGRWMWVNGAVLRQDVFSFTAHGVPWMYPVGGELFFYGIFRLGGLTLLSLLAPAACLLVALLLIRGG